MVKLFITDDGRAEIVIVPAAPVIYPGVQLFMEHTPESSVTPVHAVSFPDIFYCPPLADGAFIVAESVLNNVRLSMNDFQPLFIIDTIPKRAGPGNNCAVGNFAVKNYVYSFPVNVGFILRYG